MSNTLNRENDINTLVSERLELIRNQLGYSVSEMIQLLGIKSTETYRRLINGSSQLKASQLAQFTKSFEDRSEIIDFICGVSDYIVIPIRRSKERK